MLRDTYASFSNMMEGERRPPPDRDLPWALGVGLFSAIVYVAGMARSVGYWDAPERVIAATQVGFSHPPGSPFHALAGGAFSLAFGLLPPDLALNLFSALSGAAAAAYLYRLARLFQAGGGSDRPLAALIALTTAFSASVWAECLYAEVYAFHWFLWTAFLFYFARWSLWIGSRRDLMVSALLFGLAFSTQAGTALFAPFAVAVATVRRPEVWKHPRTLGWTAAMLCVGVSPYLALPLRAESFEFMGARHTPQTLPGFLAYVSGAQFGGAAFVRDWWHELLLKRTAMFGLVGAYSFAGIGCLALAAALWRLIRWDLLLIWWAAGAVLAGSVFLGFRWFAPEARGDIWALLVCYLWPGLAFAMSVKRRGFRASWIGAAFGTSGLFCFYFGANQTSEFHALVTPLWAFAAILLALGLSRDPGAGPDPSPPARWPRWLLGATLACQLLAFPAVSVWAWRFRPFDKARQAQVQAPRWKLDLAKMGVRKRCWHTEHDLQDREIKRLENALRGFSRSQALLLARWEVQTALEYCQRVHKRFPGVEIVEIMPEPRWYRQGERRVVVENSDVEALGTWRHNVPVFYLVAEDADPPTNWALLKLCVVGRFFFDERPYILYRASAEKVPSAPKPSVPRP